MREKTSNQSYCVLHWQEAVLHGAMDCIVLSEKQRGRHCGGRASVRKCISVKEFDIRLARYSVSKKKSRCLNM